MGKVFVFLADGFEEIEALTPVDVLLLFQQLQILLPKLLMV